jgi:hypothetical protein
MSKRSPKVETQKQEPSTKPRRSRDGSRRGQNSRVTWWKKGGPSPNPNGRPPRTPLEFKELARCYSEEAVYTIAHVMRSGSLSERRAAAQALLDRAWGKPVQPVAGPDGEGHVVPGVEGLIDGLKRIVAGAPIPPPDEEDASDQDPASEKAADEGDGEGSKE